MKRFLLFLLLLTGCPSESIEDVGALCPQVLTSATNPTTGECVTFATPCDVPLGWEACEPASLCLDDEACSSLQHCAGASADTPGTCVDNPSCDQRLDTCEDTQECNVDAGQCERPQPAQPPIPDGCITSSECGELQICPAQYGGCSADERDVTCPSHCEPACLVDEECDYGLLCNATVICGEANGGSDGPPLACAGWCVPEL